MSQFVNYTITVRNQGKIVPQIDGSEFPYGDFNREVLEDIKIFLDLLENLKSRDKFVYLGKKLYEALLKPVEVSFVGSVWRRYIIDSEDTCIRIRIVFEEVNERTELASQIINLPWEFLCYPEDNNAFLATHPRVALSYGYQTGLISPLEGYAVRESPLRVLFVHGHPSKMPVGFVCFVQKILTELGEAVEVKELENPKPGELSDALSQKPHILHFLGHGKPEELALGDLPDGETSWLEGRSLSDFLRTGGVKLVVLQACEGASPSEELAFTGTAEQLVKTHVPAAIAFRYPISQSLAWNFVKTLYKKLAAGEPIDVAVQAGRAQLATENQSHASRDFGAPVLWMRLRDGLLFATSERTPEGEKKKEDITLRDETGQVICPYQNLNAFTEETKEFFFGRVRQVEEIEQRLNQQSFVPVIGASGSGKSSVVLAGLIPRLKELGGWEILPTIRPGDDPVFNLQKIFETYFSRSTQDRQHLHDLLWKEPPNLKGLVDKLVVEANGSKKFLLVIDQFEELFTLCPDKEKGQFIKLLSQVPTQKYLSIVITLRADFFAYCLDDPELAELIKHNHPLPPLRGGNLEAAILKPAKRQGYEFEDGLLGDILEEVAKQNGILPLLEFALTQLWEKRDEVTRKITRKCYEEIGSKEIKGVVGALNRYADQFFESFDEEEQKWVKKIFCHLIQPGNKTQDTRKPQKRQYLLEMARSNIAEQKVLDEVLTKLINGRLLVAGKSELSEDSFVDLAHEALIEGWAKLNQWRQETREVRLLAGHIETAYEEWVNRSNESIRLLDGYLRKEAKNKIESLKDWCISDHISFCEKSFELFSFTTEIDYRGLDKLLKENNWRQADQETYKLMLRAAKAEERGLNEKDIKDFSCEDLRIINQLWTNYSKGKFGFSAQKKKYSLSIGNKKKDKEILKAFFDSIKWRKDGRWLNYADLIFSLDAPVAHLPTAVIGSKRFNEITHFYSYEFEHYSSPQARKLLADEEEKIYSHFSSFVSKLSACQL